MTREEFGEALLRFGGNLDRWPQGEAKAAKRLFESDPLAAKMLLDFTAFERTVADAAAPPAFGAAEIGAVLAVLDRPKETWWLRHGSGLRARASPRFLSRRFHLDAGDEQRLA